MTLTDKFTFQSLVLSFRTNESPAIETVVDQKARDYRKEVELARATLDKELSEPQRNLARFMDC